MSTEQFIAIILMMTLVIVVCSACLYTWISERLEQLYDSAVWYNCYKINRLTDDVNDVMHEVLNHTEAKETSTPKRPYVGDVILTDAHGNTWHGKLRKDYKVEAGYSFEPYSDNRSCYTCRYRDYGASVCAGCYSHSNWEGRE